MNLYDSTMRYVSHGKRLVFVVVLCAKFLSYNSHSIVQDEEAEEQNGHTAEGDKYDLAALAPSASTAKEAKLEEARTCLLVMC